MAVTLKELCRLCAKKDEFSKDLLDDNNKNVLKLIQNFIQISISECEELPTKICLNCEEKMVSFQLFVLECHKVQDSFRKLSLENCKKFKIKVENDHLNDFGAEIKAEVLAEVKDEVTAEDLISAITNNSSITEIEEIDPYDNDDIDDVDDDDDDDYMDNIAIASLKQINVKHTKKRTITPEDLAKLNNILKQANLKVKDFVKMKCHICDAETKTWSRILYHCLKAHKSKPVVFCLCGFAIKSHSVLYKHVSHHKEESKTLRKENSVKEETNKVDYLSCSIKNFVNFKCRICDKSHSSWYTLKSHSEKVHGISPTVQCVCGVTLKSKSVMYKHVQDHKNPQALVCDKCPRTTKTLAALNKHKMRHIPKSDRKYTCESCSKIFTTKEALKSHERSHIPIEARKIFHCEICNLKFTTRSSAMSHKRVVHDKIKSYVCDLCGYACGTNGELRQHRAIHSDEKPFVCQHCSKPFKTYSNLKTHMDTHADTSYVCYVCSRVLNSRRTLRKHLLVHQDLHRHICSYCGKAFKRRQTLKVHMYTHTGDKPLSCKWCDERFSYASTLRSHRMRCHPDKLAQSASNRTVPVAPADASAPRTNNYATYPTLPHTDHEYIKEDGAAVSLAKIEVDTI